MFEIVLSVSLSDPRKGMNVARLNPGVSVSSAVEIWAATLESCSAACPWDHFSLRAARMFILRPKSY